MRDYFVRFLIAGILGLFISLLFLGVKHSQASTINVAEQTSQWIWPANGVITDTYGSRQGKHKGIDIGGDLDSPIYAVEEGKVSKSYYSDSYGNVIFIKHDSGFETVYAHLNKRLVNEGQKIGRGDTIGLMGTTGDSSGVHLHFELHQTEWTVEKQNAINPVFALGDVAIGESVQGLQKSYAFHKVKDVIVQVKEEELANRHALTESNAIHAGEDIEKTRTKQQETNEKLTYIEHVVQAGETVWAISKKYHTTPEDISRWNELNQYQIVANQKLKIQQQDHQRYIVQQGDTLMSISRKSNVSVQQIRQLNQLPSDMIYPEQVLIIPE